MKKVTQLLSITLSSALVLTSAPWPAAAIGPVAEMPAFAQALAPAESLGYVASSYSPSADISHPRLIVIADLHAHVEVQHHIVDMLDGLVNKLTTGPEAQKQVQIFVEGGWQPHLEHPLASVQNPKLRAIMAEYFLQKAEIPASQAFSERHPNATNFTLTGVENKDEYEANRTRFLQSYPSRKRVLEAIARHEDALKGLSGSMEARSYQKLQDMRKAYLSGALSGDRYARALVHQAARFGISNRYVDVLQAPNASANPEFDLSLMEVNRLVSAKLAESRPLAAFFRGDEKTVRENIATVDAYLDLLKRTLSDQLTPDEVPFAYARIPQMAQVAKILLADETLNIDMTDALEQALAFYPFAFMRNDSLVTNSLTALQKGAPTDTGILIVGGFHSEAIGQYLQDHQIPYLLINPVVSRDLSTIEQLNYVERMAGDHVTPDEARADFSHSWGQAIVTRAATSITPVSDLATPAVDPAAAGEISSEIEAAIEPKKDEGPDAAGFASEHNPMLAIMGTSLWAQHFISAARGLMAIDGARSQRIDYINYLLGKKNSVAASIPAEALADPENGASFSRNEANGYVSSEPSAVRFTALLNYVMNSVPESARLLPETVDIQLLKSDVYLKYISRTDHQFREDQLPFITLGLSGVHPAIIGNESYLTTLKQLETALTNLQNGKATADDKAVINNAVPIIHELVHVFTRPGREGFVEERGVQATTLNIIARLAAQTAVEHAASVGVATTSVPTAFINEVFNVIAQYVPENGAGELTSRISALSAEGSVTLSSIESAINNTLNPDAYRQRAIQEQADLQASLIRENPQATDAEVQAALNAAEPAVVAGFPLGTPNGDKARSKLREILAKAAAYGRQA